MSTNTLPARSELDPQRMWNARSVYESDEEWQQALTQLKQQIADLRDYRGRLGESPKVLADYFDDVAEAQRLFGKVRTYPMLFYAVEQTNQEAAARSGRAAKMFSEFAAATAFARPELVALGFETLNRWMQQEPRLAIYRQYFRELEARQAHVRSPEVEELMAQVSDPLMKASQTHSILANADLPFEDAIDRDGSAHEVAHATIRQLMSSPDRALRCSAWKSYADGYLQFKNTFTNCLEAKFKQDVFYANARNYQSTLHASLKPNGVPVEVFHNLIDVYRKHVPIWHRYWELRRRKLNVDKLGQYDIRAPLVARSPEIPYEQAVDWIAEGLQPLGDEYVTVLRRGSLDERWVDVYPNRGKRQGAFSAGAPGTHPFIMMSYSDDVFGLSTLAHELGHSMHSYMTWQTQPMVYSRYSLFAAEVASNFNQAMVRAYLLETQKDETLQIALLEEAMSNFYRYFLVMPTLARFELQVHQQVERGEPLTADKLNELAADLFSEAYGDSFEIDRARVGITWAQFQHLYYNYYVYQYATGIAGAHALADGILRGENGAAESYLNFLRAGSSKYAIEALREAGVDLESAEPVEIAFATLDEYVDRLEALLS